MRNIIAVDIGNTETTVGIGSKIIGIPTDLQREIQIHQTNY